MTLQGWLDTFRNFIGAHCVQDAAINNPSLCMLAVRPFKMATKEELTQCTSGRWAENNKNFFGWIQSDNTKTTIPRFNFMFFYVFKMAVAIVSLRGFAVEAV